MLDEGISIERTTVKIVGAWDSRPTTQKRSVNECYGKEGSSQYREGEDMENILKKAKIHAKQSNNQKQEISTIGPSDLV